MMNKKDIFKKVAGIIAELNEQYEYLSQSPENLNELELELFAANADFLSDHISILQKLNRSSDLKSPDQEVQGIPKTEIVSHVVQAPVEKNTEAVETPEVNIKDWKLELDKESVESFDFEKRGTNQLFDRPLTEEEIELINYKTKLKEEAEEELEVSEEESFILEKSDFDNSNNNLVFEPKSEVSEGEENTSAKTVFEPVAEFKQQTINDILSSQASKGTVSSQFVNRQVRDLKSLISLNDKLLFVRDLFNGYSLAYSEALELLNRFDTFEAADNFLQQNYSSKNNWADKQSVADKFYEILNKRYAK